MFQRYCFMSAACLLALLLSSCHADSESASARIPLGYWKDTHASRFMFIEEDSGSVKGRQYKVTLFSHNSPKRHVSGVIKNSVFTIITSDADIPVLYHPYNELLLINGDSQYERIPIRDYYSGVERSGIY